MVNAARRPGLVIAVDGPSGAGKSSTSRVVAARLGCAYLDTGSMYRALAVWCADHRIAADDTDAVVAAARDLPLEITPSPAGFTVALDGRDVTARLHRPEVSGMVSGYAAVRDARRSLNARMRAIIAASGRIVVEGRDITTVVAPDADLRVLLQADPARRIARREAELNGAADRKTVTEQVVGRDAADSASSKFETPAAGVVLIDSTELTLEQVVDKVIGLVPAELREPARAH